MLHDSRLPEMVRSLPAHPEQGEATARAGYKRRHPSRGRVM